MSPRPPPIWALTDAVVSLAVTALVVALAGLIWLYARQEKRHGDIL